MGNPSEIVEFLRARLDEDEQVAKAATVGPWRVVNATDYHSATVDGPDAMQDGGYDDSIKARRQVMRPLTVIPQDVDYGPTVDLSDAEHIARHDPSRVLADVESKRAILAEHTVSETSEFEGKVATITYCATCRTDGECPTLIALARPYLNQGRA